jgi:hypothetical protein
LKVDFSLAYISLHSMNQNRWTSLYARDRDSKNRLAYNEFAFKKT